MNIQNLVKPSLQLLIVISLLFVNTSSATAQDGNGGEEYIGQVSTTVTRTLPSPRKGEPGFQPNASQPLPGGGTATATAQLAWNQSVMDGIARSSLSSNTVGTYNLRARVIQLYMNGAPQGGYTTPTCGDRIAGGSVSQKKSKVVASVFGKTWQVNTDHIFTKSGWSGWYVSLQAGPISL